MFLAGAFISIYACASKRMIAVVMALGAGVLVSSVAFELMDEAYEVGGFDAASLGLLAGTGTTRTRVTGSSTSRRLPGVQE